MKNALFSFAVLVGLFVMGIWAFRFLGRAADNLFYWIKYNGIYAVGAIGVLAIIWYVLFDKKE